jgi:EAL domain-containing protein (putative c-di-GMP-specific phosphodiesterase class I)
VEVNNPDKLVASIRHLRDTFTNLRMVLEIHELSLTDTELLKFFKRELNDLEVQLAFDDFGVGQSRLMEMVEAKPHLIKFDLAMIKDIDKGDLDRLKLLQGLKIIADDLNITTLAECVSREGEFNVCSRLGFDLYQGYLFGRPEPLPELAAS